MQQKTDALLPETFKHLDSLQHEAVTREKGGMEQKQTSGTDELIDCKIRHRISCWDSTHFIKLYQTQLLDPNLLVEKKCDRQKPLKKVTTVIWTPSGVTRSLKVQVRQEVS